MRNILAFLAASVICIAGLGYYLGWYSVQSTAGAAGKRQVNIDIDSRKISDDLQKGTEKLQHVIDQSRSAEATSPTTKSKLENTQPNLN
jgi:UDP-N-acetyl-D-mannosaminuronate dehydrogenase